LGDGFGFFGGRGFGWGLWRGFGWSLWGRERGFGGDLRGGWRGFCGGDFEKWGCLVLGHGDAARAEEGGEKQAGGEEAEGHG
jgi:hypothetical protein